jgi:hypothetical protein
MCSAFDSFAQSEGFDEIKLVECSLRSYSSTPFDTKVALDPQRAPSNLESYHGL